ncbi:MAG: TlpA disulfide reductase family protein [Acidobacteriota bacterium]
MLDRVRRNAEITALWIELARSAKKFSFVVTTIFFFAVWAFAQTPRTILLDADGRRLTDNEFVDLRLANRADKDPAVKTVLEDGTIQFRLVRPRQEGTDAPLFDAPTIVGKTISANDLKGKVIVLNFWFIGCPGCMEELPKLNTLAGKYRDNADVKFIAVAPNTAAELRQFLVHNNFDYQMIGSAAAIANLFKFAGYPRNIVIGRDGKIAYWRTTVRAWDKFDSVIQAELDKK